MADGGRSHGHLPSADSIYNHSMTSHRLSCVLLHGSESQLLPIRIKRRPHEGVRCGHPGMTSCGCLGSVHHVSPGGQFLSSEAGFLDSSPLSIQNLSLLAFLRTEIAAIYIPVYSYSSSASHPHILVGKEDPWCSTKKHMCKVKVSGQSTSFM